MHDLTSLSVNFPDHSQGCPVSLDVKGKAKWQVKQVPGQALGWPPPSGQNVFSFDLSSGESKTVCPTPVVPALPEAKPVEINPALAPRVKGEGKTPV